MANKIGRDGKEYKKLLSERDSMGNITVYINVEKEESPERQKAIEEIYEIFATGRPSKEKAKN